MLPAFAGFNARIALQNAQGGVNGHKLVPLVIDDQTNPTQITTAVQSAISKGAFGIVSQSPLMFLAAKVPHQAIMPVAHPGPSTVLEHRINMHCRRFPSILTGTTHEPRSVAPACGHAAERIQVVSIP